jgi:hypothetical protein
MLFPYPVAISFLSTRDAFASLVRRASVTSPRRSPHSFTPTPSSFAPLAGLKGWLAGQKDASAALKSECECDAHISNAYCRWKGVKTAGWPKVLYEQDAKLQAVLVGIEQDQRVSHKHPDKLKGENNNFLWKWKQEERKLFVKNAVVSGVKRRAAGVKTTLKDFIASNEGTVLTSALLLAKAVAITGAVGVYATCDILHTGHDFAKAMSDLAKASGGALCKSLQQKLDTSSAAPTQETGLPVVSPKPSSRFKGISLAAAGADTRTKRFKRFKGIFRAGTGADTRTRIEKVRRRVCQHFVRGFLTRGSKSRSGKFICHPFLSAQQVTDNIAAAIAEAHTNADNKIKEAKNLVAEKKADAVQAIKSITDPIFDFLGATNGVFQDKVNGGVTWASNAVAGIPNTVLDTAEAAVDAAFEALPDPTLAQVKQTCPLVLDQVKSIFDKIVKLQSSAPEVFALIGCPHIDMEFAADKACCKADTVGKPGSSCPKAARTYTRDLPV